MGECPVTTEAMEAYTLEEHDQIFVNGQIYRVIGIDAIDFGYRFRLVDDEGNQASMEIGDTIKVPVVIDTLAEV